jgi:5'(3')-deoxyribonucleotidase
MKIFLDLDGVVVNFVGPAMAYNGAWVDESNFPDGCGWDVVKAVNIIRSEKGLPELDKRVFWNSFGYDFWRNLPLYPGAKAFVQALRAHGEVYFATSPTLSSSCVAAKFDHICHEFPELKRKIIISADKSVLANGNSLLIDDRDRNCEKFREAGGEAILVPRPWNDKGYHPDPLGFTMSMFLSIEECLIAFKTRK